MSEIENEGARVSLLGTLDSGSVCIGRPGRVRWAAWLPLLVAAVASCGWFDDGRACQEGSLSCDGDEVRLCMPKVGASSGPKGPQTDWQTIETCEDDPRVGARTCAMTGEQASCVREAPDGGAADPAHEEEQELVRVDVLSDGTILDVQPQSLRGVPMGAVSGAFAVVSYREGKPIDAVLASVDEEGGSAWVRASAATSVAVVDTTGRRLSERALAVEVMGSALRERFARLSAELPPTLRIVSAEAKRRPPLQWGLAGLNTRAPTAEMLHLVGATLLQVPTVGLSGLTDIGFADLAQRELDAGADAEAAADAEATSDDAGDGAVAVLELDAGLSEDAPEIGRTRALLQGTTLWVDVSAMRLEEYRSSEPAKRELGLELARITGRAWFNLATISKRAEKIPALLPSDFPPALVALLRSRISPMLESNESFATVWEQLHWFGVTEGFSALYGGSPRKYSDTEAVDLGFAAAAGAPAADADFAEYVARATIPGVWPDGPCADLRGHKLEELAPRRFANVAKLEVLRGLGVVTGERVADCLGDLQSNDQSSGVVLHKSNGEQVWFDRDATGARTGWSDSVSILATARQDGIQAVLNVQYRGVALPSVIRLGKPALAIAETQSATFGLSDTKTYQTTGAEGGLVVIDQVTRTGINAHVLMLHVAQPKITLDQRLKDPELAYGPWGTWFFPLVTIRVAAEVGWQDDEGVDAQP
jgi:hypothetical protein